MKRLIAILVLVMLLLSSLCSCKLLSPHVSDEGDVTVVVENEDGSRDVFEVDLENVENKSEGAKGILEHLNQQKDRLYLEIVDGAYGAYITAIGNIKENPSQGTYVVVYTSVLADSYEGAPTHEYNGTTVYQSGVGLSGMSIESGTVILFRAEKSPY